MRELINELIDELQTITKCLETIEYIYIPNYTKDMREIIKRVANENINDLRESLIDFYMDRFTEDELTEIITFLKGKAGRKFLSVVSAQDEKLVKLASNWMNDVIKEADTNMEKEYLKQKVSKGISWRDYVPPLDIKV